MAIAVPRRFFVAGDDRLPFSASIFIQVSGLDNWGIVIGDAPPRFDVIWGLKTDEQVIESEEKDVEQDSFTPDTVGHSSKTR